MKPVCESHRAPRALNGFDRDILLHMLLWAPHGSLYEEDVFPEFGMSVLQFRRRFIRIVRALQRDGVRDGDRELFEDAARFLTQMETQK